jgi:hypothetical protein
MRVTEIKYQRVKNLGNFETERLEIIVAVNENEDFHNAMQLAKQEAEVFLFGEDDEFSGDIYQ